MRRKPTLAPLVKRYVDEVGTVLVERGQLAFEVRVIDVRRSYGRIEFLIEPVDGHGDAWIEGKRVRFDHLDNLS